MKLRKETPSIEAELHQMKIDLNKVLKEAKTVYAKLLHDFYAWEMRAKASGKILPLNPDARMDIIHTLHGRAVQMRDLYEQKSNEAKERIDKIIENHNAVSLALSELNTATNLERMNSSLAVEPLPQGEEIDITSKHNIEKLIHTAKALIELKTEI